MMMPEVLWEELEAEARQMTGSGVLKRMLAPDAACTMYLGIQWPSLNRLFLLQTLRSMLPSREQIPESRGFELAVQITGEESGTHATFVLRAADQVFNEIFSVMVGDLHIRLKECRDERQIVQIFLERLQQWQEFFEKIAINGLSPEAQRGLYGELYFLRNYLLSSSKYFAAEVASWTASKNRQHDFQFGRIAVEVKTCSMKQQQKLLISNECQLDETQVENLYIFHLSLSVIEGHADTLPVLISDLREMLSNVYTATSLFERLLLDRGYLDIQAWRYQSTGYAVRESNMFHVIDNFPRLTERDLLPGVGDLSYSISVADCRKFAVPLKEIITQIHREIYERTGAAENLCQ